MVGEGKAMGIDILVQINVDNDDGDAFSIE